MMNTIVRLISLLIYPAILLLCFLCVYSKEKYKNAIKNNLKYIIVNTLAITVLISLGLVIFFKFENTIYNYDYAGHWIRSLTLRKHFFEDPKAIFSSLYYSMNYYDYSYLPALFGLPLILINQSYGFFCLSNLVLFLVPTLILLEVLYFAYINKNKYLPLIVFIIIYPLYLTLFYGKVDCCGLFFITLVYSLVILPKFEDITLKDNLIVNLCAFLAIFLRRWYLYSVICLYIACFIKWLCSNKNIKSFFKLVSSGIIALIIVLIAFRPFLLNSLSNNFEEAYAIYNNDGKLLSLINNISPLVLIVCLFGCIKLFNDNKQLLIINIESIIIPCILVWRIQSFEYHHYYIFLLNIIILFVYGIIFISSYKRLTGNVLLVILLLQPIVIFSNIKNTMPLYTNIRKNPEILYDKEEIIDLSYYLRSIEADETQAAFLVGGRYGIITDDLLRNAILPDLDSPRIDSAVLDLRDGFPEDFEYIKYILVVDPMLYTNQEYQHMFDVIANGIINEPSISKIYNPIYSAKIDNYNVTVYERTEELTKEMKEYFYNEMIKHYPDKEEFFSYILD